VRVLFDTNVLYSAFTSKGFCEEVVDEAAGDCLIIWSPPLQAELVSLLTRRNKIGPGAQAALAAFAELCECVEPQPLPAPVCRDADDDIVLATALAAQADFIVTGDDDLLTLKEHQGIRIVSPREFWKILVP